MIDFELVLSNLILLIEPFQSLDGLLRNNALNHWSILFVVSSEVSDILNQHLDVLFEGFQILSLLNSEIFAYFFGEIDKV